MIIELQGEIIKVLTPNTKQYTMLELFKEVNKGKRKYTYDQIYFVLGRLEKQDLVIWDKDNDGITLVK